jgi:hypothetical protein
VNDRRGFQSKIVAGRRHEQSVEDIGAAFVVIDSGG